MMHEITKGHVAPNWWQIIIGIEINAKKDAKVFGWSIVKLGTNSKTVSHIGYEFILSQAKTINIKENEFLLLILL